MRTTVTLDPDAEQLLRQRMAERKVSFKQALNDAIRAAFGAGDPEPFRTKTYDMGVPKADLTKALQIAGELEDAEIVRKLRQGK
jgi:hypothetical protein